MPTLETSYQPRSERPLSSVEKIKEAEQLIEINQISADIFNRVPVKGQPEMESKLASAEKAWINDLKQMNLDRREARNARIAMRAPGAEEAGSTATADAAADSPANGDDASLESDTIPLEGPRDRAITFFIETYYYFFEEIEHYLETPLTPEQQQELAAMMVDTLARLVQVRTNTNTLRDRLGRVLGVFDRFRNGDPQRKTSRHTFMAAMNGRADNDQNIASFMASRVVNRIVEMKKNPAIIETVTAPHPSEGLPVGMRPVSVTRYGETIPVSTAGELGATNTETNPLLYAARPKSERTESGNPVLNQLEAERAQAQLEESIALLSPEKRKDHLKLWLSERFRERPKIAGTAFDNRILREISRSREIMNGLAGVIMYGPPGTGKTQCLIEANHQDGFETRVISIHKYTDMVQLLGEPEIQVSMGLGTSPLSNLRQLVGDPAVFQTWLQESKVSGRKSYNQVVEFVRTHRLNPNEPLSDDMVAVEFVNTLKELELSNGLAATEGITREQAWLKGEILRAIQNKERVVLDEIEKTQPGGLDSISNFLTLKPGDMLKLGVEEVQIPYWFRVDATANALTLPEHLKNRFSTTIHLEYPPAADMLQKVALWMANDNGDITLPVEDQARLVGVVMYLVPRIQELYEHLLEERTKAEADTRTATLPPVLSPLSLRNLAVFCQEIANGRKTVDEAIDTYFLAIGQLSQAEDDAWLRLEAIVSEYRSFFALEKAYRPPMGAEPLLDSVANSALFANLPVMRVDATKRQTIPELQGKLPPMKKQIEDNSLLLSNGWQLQVDEKHLVLIGGGVILWKSDFGELGTLDKAELLDSSDDGKAVILKVNDQSTHLLTPFTSPNQRELQNGRDWVISPDGRVAAGVTNQGVTLQYVGQETGETKLILPTGVRPNQLQFNQDGSHLLVKDAGKEFDILVPDTYMARSKVVDHRNQLPGTRWQFVRNILVQA